MDTDVYNILLTVAAGFLVVALLIAMDGLVAMFQCALATYICWTLDTTISNAMLVVALLGFISTVSVTRFRKRDS